MTIQMIVIGITQACTPEGLQQTFKVHKKPNLNEIASQASNMYLAFCYKNIVQHTVKVH